MTLEEQLLSKLVSTFEDKGKNLQSIMDTQLFKDMSLDRKVKFINTYKEKLAQDPKFNWKAMGMGGISGAMSGMSTAMLAGAASGRINPAFMKNAVGMGALAGAGIGAYWANKSYKDDLRTSKTLDDAIQTIIDRSLARPGAPTPTPYLVEQLSKMKNLQFK